MELIMFAKKLSRFVFSLIPHGNPCSHSTKSCVDSLELFVCVSTNESILDEKIEMNHEDRNLKRKK